jgi:hypothetical protein
MPFLMSFTGEHQRAARVWLLRGGLPLTVTQTQAFKVSF